MPVGLIPVLLPFLLLLSPLVALYSIARGARLTAWRLFVRGGAPVPVHDPQVARLKTLRTWAAVAVSIAVVAALGSLRDLDQHLTEHWATLLLTPWLLIASGPVVLGVLIWLAPPTRRATMRAALRGPLRQLGLFFGTLALIPALFYGLDLLNPSHVGGNLGTLLILACVVAGMWSVFLFLFASATVARTGFGTAAVHPATPALLTSVLVWEIAAIGGLPNGPPVLAYVLLVGGPATVTALSCWEISRLRSRYGVRLRG
ncbi:hypothetical protein OYE22_25645 [Streptomyces sp. 71268]|uniref:hypothetical protein n=1 Tax=Streptomyces sp. 71268 TaxID=3002640 RepID=UPI0023F63E53|nr:hypothetical protein [Streptomyces sp. 71268]WEV28181.1 hypothetical protein OYE22_25645 [Streptomyces sp. 71268]